MAVKFKAESFKKISLGEMCDYIEKNYPEDKAWFKKVAYEDKEGNTKSYEDKDGNIKYKYNHLNAVRKFCEKYAPELIPEKDTKIPPTKRLENW